MRTKKMDWLLSTPLVTVLLLFSVCTASAADKVICVPWEGDPAKPHTAISGIAAQITCVVKTDAVAGTRYYKWVYGDGTESGISSLGSSTNAKYNLATTHSYSAAVGTPFTAQLLVASNNAVSNPVTGTYRLKLEDNKPLYGDNNLDARINIAIDKSLWWLYTNANNGGSTYDGSAFMSWYDSYDVFASPTASAVHAFAINNHKLKGDPNVDPYAEAVKLGMNFLMKGNRALMAVSSLADTYTINSIVIPGNGYGIQTVGAYNNNSYYGYQHQVYEGGQVMDAIIASGALPDDSTDRDFAGRVTTDPNYHEWTYKEVLQDMSDMYTTHQHSPNGAWAEWGFDWGEYDNSSSQWAAIGYIPAMASPWNINVPGTVKTRLASWLTASYCASGNTGYMSGAYFGYQGACNNYNDNAFNTTPSGMVMMSLAGQIGYNDPGTTVDERDAKWIGAEKFMADNWNNFMNNPSLHGWGGNIRSYGFYAMTKAMRLALPQPVERIAKSDGTTSFDWYRGDANNKGLAQRIVEMQSGYGTGTGGSWSGTLTSAPLTTAWMTIILKPSLFASSPTACFNANPNPTYSDALISFDPSCSGHSETGKTIANLTKFEWDWDNSGTFDEATTLPTIVSHSFTCASPPCTFPVKLKVSDDNDPPLTATVAVNINITNPPHPPVANAGGPYVTSLCANDSLTLNGSASFHPDQGQFEAGCTTCVGAKINKYDWDLVAPLTGFTDASTVDPTVTVAPASFFTASGPTAIALRVTDNAKSGPAFPNSGLNADQTGTAFGSVDVKDKCLCTLTARAKTGMVQLNWAAAEHTVTTTYNIYRSTAGPNTGFTKIRSGYINKYALFVDTGLTNGTTYYYRVEKVLAAGGTCGSQAVSGKPMGL